MRYLLVAALVLAPATARAATPADTVVKCMGANLPETLRVQAIEVTTWDRNGGERLLKGRVFASREKGRDRVMARVEFPSDLAGTAFLVREGEPAAEMYLYLPAVNRVKRIAGSTMNGKLWGTDFSYNEFRRVANAFAGGTVELGAVTTLDGRTVQAITLVPPPGESDPYDSIRVLVDQQTCVPLQAEFRRGLAVRKLMTAPAASLRQAGSQWYSGELTLRDLVEGTRTRLRVMKVTAGARLSGSYFHPQQFYSVR